MQVVALGASTARHPCYEARVPGSLFAFAGAVLFGAVALVVHLAVLLSVWRAPELSRTWHYAALLPPVTPIAAWRSGRRFAAIAWAASVSAYVAVRIVGLYIA